MPEQFIFHKTDAFAFYGIGDNDGRLLFFRLGGFECGKQFLVIVAVRFDDIPAECFELIAERSEIKHLFDRSETLDLIVINDRDH